MHFGLEDWRARGGVDVDAILQAARVSGLRTDSGVSMEVLRAELEDRIDAMQGQQGLDTRPPPQKGTVRWYLQNADKPIAAGVAVTVRQACFCMAALKLRGGMTVSALDTMCRMLASGGFLPAEDNLMPRCARAHSYYDCIGFVKLHC